MDDEYVSITPLPNELTPLLQVSTWEKLHSECDILIIRCYMRYTHTHLMFTSTSVCSLRSVMMEATLVRLFTPAFHASIPFNYLTGIATIAKATMMITTVTRSTIQRIVIEITIVAVGIVLDPTHRHVSINIVVVYLSHTRSTSKQLDPSRDSLW